MSAFTDFLEKGKVLRPGSRGGKGYYDDKGQWQYGEKPKGRPVGRDITPPEPERELPPPAQKRGIPYATQLPLFPEVSARKVPIVPGGMVGFPEGTIGDDAGAYEWAAEQWDQWGRAVSKDRDIEEALDQYVQEGYAIVNQNLRYANGGFDMSDGPPSWLVLAAEKYLGAADEDDEGEDEDDFDREQREWERVEEYIDVIHQGVDAAMHLPGAVAPENMVVYRGCGSLDGQIPDFAVGDTFTDPGYASSSLIRGWVEKHFGQGLMVQIHVPKGYPCIFPEAAGIVGRSREWEVILDADTTFRVEDKTDDGWLVVSVVPREEA